MMAHPGSSVLIRAVTWIVGPLLASLVVSPIHAQQTASPPDSPTKQVEQSERAEPAGTQQDEDAQPTLDELLGTGGAETAPEEGLPDVDEELEGDSGVASPSAVFMEAVESMRGSAHRLVDFGDPGLTTQRFQEDAIRKLDLLISMAQSQSRPRPNQQPQPGQPGGQPQPDQQQAGSGENPGVDSRPPAREAELDGEIEETRTEWGQLPARIRDLLMQGAQERSSVLYRRLTERYYQRLAEESRQ